MKIRSLKRGLIGFTIILFFFFAVFKYSYIKAGTADNPDNTDYEAYPPFSISGAPPLVMLTMSTDYKLLTSAYNDTVDLDGDGMIDVSYKNNIDYYGYFDPFKCYTYSIGTFTPSSKTSSDHYCSGTTQEWSGNFLNWLAMSRIDTIRKSLYGGKRITDNSANTVLGGEWLPRNSISWAKEYLGNDSRKLTPFDPPSGSVSAVCTAPDTDVLWSSNINGITNPILRVNYSGGTSTTLPTTEAGIISSYNPCGYTGYFYEPTINIPVSTDIFPQRGNFYFVTEFNVTTAHTAAGFPWKFSVSTIGANEAAAVFVDGTKVADYLSGTKHNGQINLSAGWHRLIVVHRDNQGTNDKDGITVSYISPTDKKYVCSKQKTKICKGPSDTTTCGSKGPCIAASPPTQSTTYKVFGSDSSLTLRAPYLGADANDPCRLKHMDFITTGTPQEEITVDCGGGTANNRHLFCITGNSTGTSSMIRALRDVPYRPWNWASLDGSACGTNLDTDNNGVADTSFATSLIDMDVKVDVCKTSPGLEDNCKKYGSNYKPTGLLQKHGEGDANNKVCSKSGKVCNNDNDCNTTGEGVCIIKSKMYFGLVAGTRDKPEAGGVLRKNIWSFMNEVVDTTGILNTNTDNTNPGSGNVAVGHIVNALNNIRWTGNSNMWGNPVGEIMYEATRYLMDKGTPTTDFYSGVTSSPLAGWLKPYSQIFPSCSKPFIVAISDINPSYDSDQLPGSAFGSLSTDLTGLDVSNYANIISSSEGIDNNSWLIGQTTALQNSLCTGKTVLNLSSVRGLCPEEPSKNGSYYSAAVAYYGHTKGTPQPIGYYSFVQPSKLPVFEINVGGNKVAISPLAKNIYGNYFADDQATTNCYNKCSGITTLRSDGSLNLDGCSSTAVCQSNQIAASYIEDIEYDNEDIEYDNNEEDIEYDNNKNVIYANFRVNFDDAQRLNDFDMDSIVRYEIITKAYVDQHSSLSSIPPYNQLTSSDQVLVKIKREYAASGYATALGFTIAGTTADNYYLPLRDDNTTPLPFSSLANEWYKVFTVSSTGTSGFLKDPLWYAAKWGSFTDKNSNSKPDLQSEWDQDNNNVPDGYYLLANPLQLEQKLEEVFLDILKRTASGTAVSVLASSAEGEGALFQAFFKPILEGDYGPIKWTGFLQGLFVDYYGNIREDTDQDGSLNLTIDRIVKFRLDTTTQDTVADLYQDTDGDGKSDGTAIATVPLPEIKSLWEAGKKLALKDPQDRVIFTSTNGTESGRVSLETGNVASLKDYLGPKVAAASDPTLEANKVINFARGENVEGFRSRFVSVNNMQRVWKLGDIVYSTPTVVAAPSENYDLIYGDKSYFDFYNAYKNRMSVVYAGSNDGILHAFYAGVYHQGDNPSTAGKETGWFDDTYNLGLGNELWGFIPRSFLPHLYWQTQDDYRHIFGVDLKPKIVDLKIFTPDSVHIGGWGTVLIGGMRLGAGEIKSTISGTPTTFYASYFAIDITNPQTPKLLWEFSHPDLGLTLSYPSVVKRGDKWYAVFGSGPMGRDPNTGATTSYKDSAGYYALSTKTGKLFVVDIQNGGSTWTQGSNYWIIDTGLSNAVMGSPVTLDSDLDFSSDVIYIGAAYGTNQATQGGAFYRILTQTDTPTGWVIRKVLDTASNARPLLSAPAVSIRNKDLWIYISSGRFLHSGDKVTSNQEKMYGFKDPCYNSGFLSTCTTTLTESSLFDVSGVVVKVTGNVEGASGITGSTSSTFDQLKNAINFSTTKYGWLCNMTEAKERGVAKPALIGDVALFTTFVPTGDVCGGGGHGNIYALYSVTGTAYVKPIIGTTGDVLNKKLALSSGTPSSISIHMGRETGGKAYIQQSTGEILSVEFQTAAKAKSGFILWREKW